MHISGKAEIPMTLTAIAAARPAKQCASPVCCRALAMHRPSRSAMLCHIMAWAIMGSVWEAAYGAPAPLPSLLEARAAESAVGAQRVPYRSPSVPAGWLQHALTLVEAIIGPCGASRRAQVQHLQQQQPPELVAGLRHGAAAPAAARCRAAAMGGDARQAAVRAASRQQLLRRFQQHRQ